LLILPLVKVFHGLRAVLHSEWQRIARSSTRQRLSPRFAHCITQRMSADCSYFRWSKSFTVCAPDCATDVSGLLIPPLFNGFPDGSRPVLLCGWHWIARTSARQWLSQRFTGRFAQQMAAPCSFFRSSKAFTVCALDCSTDVSGLLIPLLFSGFPDGSHPVLLCGWHWIAHTSARQRLSRRFAPCISPRMVVDWSFFLLSEAFTVCAPYCSSDGSGLLILPLVNGFPNVSGIVLLNGS